MVIKNITSSAGIVIIIFVGLVIQMHGVSWITASIDYSKGTRALDARDYVRATKYLEKTVEILPLWAKARTNLAAAYAFSRKNVAAWREVRKALIIDHKAPHVLNNFNEMWRILQKHGVFNYGVSKTQITRTVGEPDIAIKKKGKVYLVYGNRILLFVNDNLVAIKEVPFNEGIWSYIQVETLWQIKRRHNSGASR